MSLSKEQEAIKTNIKNAFKVVHSLYDNISNLFKLLKEDVEDYGFVSVIGDFFLKDLYGINSIYEPYKWSFNNGIVLLQRKTSNVLENGFRDGPMYAVEINFSLPWDEEPCVYLHRIDYKDILGRTSGCKQSNHWVFYWPTRDKENNTIEILDEKRNIIKSTPKEESYQDKHWGYVTNYRMKIDLVDLTSDNIKERIFDNFDYLDEIAKEIK